MESNPDILKELIRRITPICRDDEELSAISIYVKTDKYRQKMIDFLKIAEEKGDVITGDNLLILTVLLSNEEEAEYGMNTEQEPVIPEQIIEDAPDVESNPVEDVLKMYGPGGSIYRNGK